jgi:hypothetical protein
MFTTNPALLKPFGVTPSLPSVTIPNARNREALMRSRPVDLSKPYPLVRITLVVLLTLMVGGWDTCSAFVGFKSCQGTASQAQIASLMPDAIPGDTNSVPLTVAGSGFTPQSEIMWNGATLPTTFIDSNHLQTTITRETFEGFGGAAGSSVKISVKAQGSGDICPPGGNSATLDLAIH